MLTFSVQKVSIYSFQVPKYPQNLNYVNTRFYKKIKLVNKFNVFPKALLSALGAGSRRFESARPDQLFNKGGLTYQAYVTSTRYAGYVQVETPTQKVLISPENPGEFVGARTT
jgi:hypothetical protein